MSIVHKNGICDFCLNTTSVSGSKVCIKCQCNLVGGIIKYEGKQPIIIDKFGTIHRPRCR